MNDRNFDRLLGVAWALGLCGVLWLLMGLLLRAAAHLTL